MNVLCKICNKRRARRHCPGVGGEICPQCCGTERENTVDCPHDCEHLRAARVHEQLAPIPSTEIPNQDIRVTNEFIQQHEQVITWTTAALARAMETERAVDFDARQALDALIRTYRTLDSGLIYETRPENPYAARLQQALQESIEDLRKNLAQEGGVAAGMNVLRDADVLGALVFLQRLEMQHNNGRRRGRAFFDFLRSYFPVPAEASAASVIQP